MEIPHVITSFITCGGEDRAEKIGAMLTPNALFQTQVGQGPELDKVSVPAKQWLARWVELYPEYGLYKPEVYTADMPHRFIVRSAVVKRAPDPEDPTMLGPAELDAVMITLETEGDSIRLVRWSDNPTELWPRRYLRTWDMEPEAAAVQREKNLETIRYLMTLGGPDRNVKRAPHFAQDGLFQNFGLPMQSAGEWLGYVADQFPEWGYYRPVIFSCDDPTRFVVETYVVGKMIQPEDDTMYAEHVLGAMLITFELWDGKVKLFRETPNETLVLSSPR